MPNTMPQRVVPDFVGNEPDRALLRLCREAHEMLDEANTLLEVKEHEPAGTRRNVVSGEMLQARLRRRVAILADHAAQLRPRSDAGTAALIELAMALVERDERGRLFGRDPAERLALAALASAARLVKRCRCHGAKGEHPAHQ